MKSNKILLSLLAIALLGFSACDGYLDINENPNVATRPPLDGLLATTSYGTAINQFSVADDYGAYFVQYLASPNESSTTDIYLETGYSSWGEIYGTMTDLFDLIKFGTEDEAEAHVGIARVLTAINLGLIIDSYDNAPYSAAFTGEILRPEYDNGENLYSELFGLLDQALVDFDSYDDLPALDADSDFIHAGDLDAWRKTISAIRARYLNHLSETDQYDPSAVLAAVDAAYASSADDADLETFQVRNPWAQVAVNNAALLLDGWLSEQFVDALNGTTYGVFDPRLPLLTDTTDVGTYVGTVNGAGRAGDGTAATESYLEITGAKSCPECPLDIISFTELKFIEAEAALQGGNDTRSRDAFVAGVTASMEEIGVPAEAITEYLEAAYPGLNIDADDIFREKYVALFLSPETWVDARRYNYAYEDFTLPENAALSTFPSRVQYPNSELDRNPNVPIVQLTDPVFWDR